MNNEQLYKSLKRRRQVSLFSIAIFIAGIFAMIFFFFKSMDYKKQLREKNQLLEKQRNAISEMKNNLANQSDSLFRLIAEKDSMLAYYEKASNLDQRQIERQKQVIREVVPLINIQKQTDISAKRYDNSKYIINLHTFGVNPAKLKEIRSYFREKGYTVDNSFNHLKELPTWMAKQPTIFYYSNKSEAKAEEVSKELMKLIKKKFVISKGNTSSIIPGQEAYSFSIHFME